MSDELRYRDLVVGLTELTERFAREDDCPAKDSLVALLDELGEDVMKRLNKEV